MERFGGIPSYHASPESVKRSPQTRTTATRSPYRRGFGINEPIFLEHDAAPVSSAASSSSSIANSSHYEVAGGGSVSSPKDVLKLLGRIRALEEERSTNVTVLASLRSELKHTRTDMKELELAYKSTLREVEGLRRRIVEERESWRIQEDSRVREAVEASREDAEKERKARRRVETLNRKLSRKLSDANKAIAEVLRELEGERKSRALMEDVCDELAREIGQDKAEMEVLKRKHARVREEVGEEQKMLQVAEAWREERVQMKLADAKHELEERVSTIDWLKCKLEEFLQAQSSPGGRIDAPEREEIMEAKRLRNAIDLLHLHDTNATAAYQPSETATATNEVVSATTTQKVLTAANFNQRHHRWMLENPEEQNSHAREDREWPNESHNGYYSRDGSEDGGSFDGGADGECDSEAAVEPDASGDWERASEFKEEGGERDDEESNWRGESDDGTLSEEGGNDHRHEHDLSDRSRQSLYEPDIADGQSIWSVDSIGNNERDLIVQGNNNSQGVRFDSDRSYFQQSMNGLPNTTPQVIKGIRGFIGWSKGLKSGDPNSQSMLLETRFESQKYQLRDEVGNLDAGRRSYSRT